MKPFIALSVCTLLLSACAMESKETKTFTQLTTEAVAVEAELTSLSTAESNALNLGVLDPKTTNYLGQLKRHRPGQVHVAGQWT